VLAAGIAQGENPTGSPIIDLVTVAAGYETALGAALGDDLTAPLGTADDMAVRWDTLPDLQIPPPLPAGASPLTQFVPAAPPAFGPPPAPDRPGRRRRDRSRAPTGAAAGPTAGHGRRRSVALGRLHAARRRPERRPPPG